MGIQLDVTISALKSACPALAADDKSFAESLISQFENKGKLSEKQWHWVEKLAQRATTPEPRRAPVGLGDFSSVLALFETAKSRLKYPKIRLEARKLRDIRLAGLRGELHTWPTAVGRWMKEWLPQNVDGATAERYLVSIGQIKDAMVTDTRKAKIRLADLPIEHISNRTIGEVVEWSKLNRQGVTNATLRRDLTALSRLLFACIGWSWREDNPARTWDRGHIKERRDPIVLPTDEEIALVCEQAPGLWPDAIRLMRRTGMRMEEAFGPLRPRIAKDLSGATLSVGTKRDKVRFVPFDSEAQAIVMAIPVYLKCKHLIWHGEGEPYRNISSNFLSQRARLKLPDGQDPITWSLHDLRHLFAVEYLREGRGSIYDLQQVMGHGSIKVTEQYLAFLSPDQKGKVMRMVSVSA